MDVQFFPKRFVNTYKHWLDNIKDWNISRQLWWGHQIPAYFYGNGVQDFAVPEQKEEALALAQAKTGKADLKLEDLKQDNDALDTWFSSWLWPISVFDGIRDPENKDIQYYYPTNDLITNRYHFLLGSPYDFCRVQISQRKAFPKCIFHGYRKRSFAQKNVQTTWQLTQSADLIAAHGADAVRCGMLFSSAAGNDLLFDEELIQQGKSFANKIWNGFRLVKGWETDSQVAQPESAQKAIVWYETKFQQTLANRKII